MREFNVYYCTQASTGGLWDFRLGKLMNTMLESYPYNKGSSISYSKGI